MDARDFKIPKTEKSSPGESRDSLKPLGQYGYEVTDKDWLHERSTVIPPSSKVKRISAAEKAKILNICSNWKLYIEMKKKLEAHKLVNLDYARKMSENNSSTSAVGSVEQMETIPSNTECLNKQLALENIKDLDSTTSEYKRPTVSSLYTEPKTLNLDVNQ